jgi:hypothetical protein
MDLAPVQTAGLLSLSCSSHTRYERLWRTSAHGLQPRCHCEVFSHGIRFKRRSPSVAADARIRIDSGNDDDEDEEKYQAKVPKLRTPQHYDREHWLQCGKREEAVHSKFRNKVIISCFYQEGKLEPSSRPMNRCCAVP